ncbi:MAG: family 16 glycosylhydrolase [Gemmatimonas sp.]
MALDLSTFHLTFNDDFNSFNANPDGNGAWKTQFYFGGRSLPSNGEQQYYSDATVGADPFRVEDGHLVITASPGDNAGGNWYNSGLVTTEGTFSQTYGYFEIGAQLPEGQGMWPAFWLLSTDKAWPPEIDVLEAFGADNGRGEGGGNEIHVNSITSHWDTGGGGDWVPTTGNIFSGDHVYGVDWEPDTTTFYMDGQELYHVATPSDMHSPMYMLANLAVGGNWAGGAAGENGEMKIDFIRAWSHDAPADNVPLNGNGAPEMPEWVAHDDAPPPADAMAADVASDWTPPPADQGPQAADVPPADVPPPEVAYDAPPQSDWLQA